MRYIYTPDRVVQRIYALVVGYTASFWGMTGLVCVNQTEDVIKTANIDILLTNVITRREEASWESGHKQGEDERANS